jgi:NitT/TauT family transport system substrate-binding protein
MKHALFTTVAAAAFAFAASAASALDRSHLSLPGTRLPSGLRAVPAGKGQGLFREAGLDVTFQVGKGGADVATQVALGNADLGGGIGDTPIIVRANGLEIRGVALLGGRGLTQLAWRADSGSAGPRTSRASRSASSRSRTPPTTTFWAFWLRSG